MILLSTQTFDWAVVEVELEHHSISGHIDDQLDRLSRAVYGFNLMDSFAQHGVTRDDAREYLSRRPSMLCIVDGGSPRLKDCCSAHGFDMAVMTPYANELAEPALQVLSMPGQYRAERPSPQVDFSFRMSTEAIFGRSPFVVPDEFPPLERLIVREAGDEVHVQIVNLSGNRLMFPPPNLKTAATHGFKLSVIDIDRAIFELLKD